MSINFMIGGIKWEHKPNTKQEIAECQSVSHYITKEATPSKMYEWITQGRCWRAGVLKPKAYNFKKESFAGAQVLALDFDEFSQSPPETVNYCRQLEIEPNFWYYSFSQGTKPFYNYRVVWVLNRLLSQEEYESLYKRILADEVFSKSDPATKDLNRLWYGTNKGGEFIKEELIDFSKFDIFQSEDIKPAKRGNKKETELEQAEIPTQFIMKNDFNWSGDLAGVCDLWDKWTSGVYLHYPQRLLLFSELKMIRYETNTERENKERENKHKFLNEIMAYYNPVLYEGSKCNRREIAYFLSDKTRFGIDKKIVRYNGKEYTIADYFNSGAYLERRRNKKKKVPRITREELKLKADEIIPQALNSKGINYVDCQTEAGKTERILDFLATQDYTQKKIIYAMPTHILLKEAIARANRKGITNIIYPRKVDYSDEDLLYLDAGYPEGITVSQDMIARKKELEIVKDKNAKGLFFITHQTLAHLSDITADLIIIDENIEDVLIDRNIIYLEELNALRAFIPIIKDGKGNRLDGRQELDKLIKIVEEGEETQFINEIDIPLMFKYLNYEQLVNSDLFRNTAPNTGIRKIGKLKDTDILRIGEDTQTHMRYLYYEKTSKLLRNCLDKDIPVKLFTGTAKIEQLKRGLMRDKELIEAIGEPIVIPRADPLGNVFDYYDKGARGSKATLRDTFRYAIETLEKQGVNWQEIPLLTLKSGVRMAKEDYHFLIPTTESGEEIYIENSAGIDALKGKDLIVIGKADIPDNAYFDMVGEPHRNRKKKNMLTYFEDTGIERVVYRFKDEEYSKLWKEQVREKTEQAVARARTLWYNCNVYLFCDYPVRGQKDGDGEE